MVMDSSEMTPQLLARWKGAEDLKEGINTSLNSGKCRQILEELEKGEITIDNAVSDIMSETDEIHKKTH